MKRLIPVVLAVVIFAFQAESNETWRGLVIAPEDRCSDYASSDYSYPQSVEPEIIEAMGGGSTVLIREPAFRAFERPTSSTSSPAPRLTTADCALPMLKPSATSLATCST